MRERKYLLKAGFTRNLQDEKFANVHFISQ
jgi:hypothetical protein